MDHDEQANVVPALSEDTRLGELLTQVSLLRSDIQDLRANLGSLPAIPPKVPAKAMPTVSTPQHRRRPKLPHRLTRTWQRLQAGPLAQRSHETSPGRSRWWDIAAVALVLLVAILLRFVHLSSIPRGIHGDEAMAVLQGRRTLEIGWYGPWNPMAGGFPAGFIYLAAPMVWIFGDNVMAVRYLSAGLDILTVALLYFTLRRAFGYWTALIGALFLGVSAFEIQFARTAFPNILWPTLVMLGLFALGEALHNDNLLWWAASGAGIGLAIYSYNAQSIYLIVLGVFFALFFAGVWVVPLLVAVPLAAVTPSPWSVALVAGAGAVALFSPALRVRRVWLRAITFLASFAVASYPMAKYILNDRDTYFDRSKGLSLFQSDIWLELDSRTAQARFLIERYAEFWSRLTRHPVPDAVDGSGGAPFVPLLMMALCLIGIAIALARRRHPLVLLGVLTLGFAPVTVFWSADFALRRAMIIMPFVAMFAAVAIVELVRMVWSNPRPVKIAAIAIASLVVVEVGWRNYDNFFNRTITSSSWNWVFSPEYRSAMNQIAEIPGPVFVYSWSPRWGWGHEVQAMMLPDTPGVSRGDPFGPYTLDLDWSQGRPVVVLLYDFQKLLPDFQARYPGGEVILGPKHWEPSQVTSYTIYVLPESPP